MVPAFRLFRFSAVLALLFLTACQGLPQKQQAATEQPATPTNNLPEIETAAQEPATPTQVPAETSSQIEDAPAPAQQAEATEQPATVDVWQRLRAGLNLEVPDNPRVQRQLNWYRKNPKYLQRLQERARPYLFHIVEQVESRGLPMELALLPAVESAFKPFAYSPGRAAGLWQFIPSTGKLYGLKQNWWYDGRRDVVSATDAALTYLERSAQQLNGDWELALASYNAGIGNVQRAIRKNRKRNKPEDFWSLDLPTETRGYIPKLLALAKIFKDPDAYGLKLDPLPNEPYFETIDIDSQLDLALAADMAGISIEELYRLNPGFNRWATDPDGPHRLNLPVASARQFSDRLAELDPTGRLRWKRYRIQPRDSLISIAKQFSISVGMLRSTNKIQGNSIRAGKHLLIPVSSKGLNQYAFSAGQRKARIQQTPRKGEKTLHIVQPGDSLWQIGRLFGVSHKSIARWNGMAPGDPLKPGQKLVIWKSDKAGVSLAGEVATPASGPAIGLSRLNYRVRRGDSLYSIADRFNVGVGELKGWNPNRGKYLQPGDTLTLYVKVTEQL